MPNVVLQLLASVAVTLYVVLVVGFTVAIPVLVPLTLPGLNTHVSVLVRFVPTVPVNAVNGRFAKVVAPLVAVQALVVMSNWLLETKEGVVAATVDVLPVVDIL